MLSIYGNGGLLIKALQQGYGLVSRSVITATGSSTYTVPANVRALYVECLGGGGGGATTANASSAQCAFGTGGCAGAYASSLLFTYPGQTFTAVVHAGGTANNNGGVTTLGATTSSSVSVSALGGNAGVATASGTAETFNGPGASPVGSAQGDLTTTIGVAPLSHRISGTVALANVGAAGPSGGGPTARITQGTGTAGGKYGAGGSGGLSFNAGGAGTGGHGGQGLIMIWELA